jgi:2-polyprenyl-6-hydroxyphenyl methylase/3-demethylubiquinone-9 3-methyltransferase
MPVDNELYDQLAATWWDERAWLHGLRALVNPGRLAYFRAALAERLGIDPAGQRVLDVGCGGGFLAEELARLGCCVTGIDPSAASITAAQAHAARLGLAIEYCVGAGEALPFADTTFDIVCCCDVLEHVRDVNQVVAEIARVLRPGGIFFYDTPHRTLLSKLILIKVLQDWPWTRSVAPNLHDWQMFIEPRELHAIMARHGIVNQDTAGLTWLGNPMQNIRALLALVQLKRGKITYADVGQRVPARVGRHTWLVYMGYGVRR